MSRILHSRAFTIVFGLINALVAAEFFLRWVAPVPLLPRYVVETAYGVRGNQPNVTYYHMTPECYVKMETNSHGIRSDREIPYEKPPGIKRIVALGDSFGMGYEVDYEQMFLVQLESCLRGGGIPCEVVNLSVSGHGNSEELIALRAEGFKYDPDLVLVCWSDSDLVDNVRSSLFKLDGDKLVSDKPSYLPGTAVQQKLSSFAPYRFIMERSQLYSFIREKAAGMFKDMIVQLRVARKPKGTGPAGDRQTDADDRPSAESGPVAAAPRPVKLTNDDRLSIALLKQIERESSDHHARTLVLDIPLFALENKNVQSSFPRDPEGKDFGLRVVHPVDVFRATPQKEQLFRLQGHFHFTPIGCRIVGELLCKAILNENLLSTSATKP